MQNTQVIKIIYGQLNIEGKWEHLIYCNTHLMQRYAGNIDIIDTPLEGNISYSITPGN